MNTPVEMIVWAFKDEKKADEVLQEMKKMDKKGTIDILNAAVLVKSADGKVSIKETEDVDARHGAVFGAIVGGLVGLLGGPAGVIVGAAAGAAAGGVAAEKIDMGFSDQALEEIQGGLQPGSSAIIALIEHEWVARVVSAVESYGVKIFRQTIKEELAAQLKEEKSRKQ